MMATVPNLPGQTSGMGTARNLDELLETLRRPENVERFRRGEYVGAWNPEGAGVGLDPAKRFVTRLNAIRSGLKTEQMGGFDLYRQIGYDVTPEALRAARNQMIKRGAYTAGGGLTAGALTGALQPPEDAVQKARDFLAGLRGETETGMGVAQSVGGTLRNIGGDPLALASVLPFGIATRPLSKIKTALGSTGSVGKEFETAKGGIVGSLFTEAGTPIAPASASALLQSAQETARRTGITLEEALLANPGGLTTPELGVLRGVRNADFVTDPNAPTDALRLFQNPANPEASSAMRAGAVARAAVTRKVKGQDFITNPSKKELDLGKGVRFDEYPAAEYAKISPGSLPSYVDQSIDKSGSFGLIVDDLTQLDGKTRSAIPLSALKDPEQRTILKAKAVENLVRVGLTSNSRLRIAALYWYPRAGEIARRYENPKQMADVMAAMSPSMPWAANIDAAVGLKTLQEQGLLDDIIQAVRKYDEGLSAKTLTGAAKKKAEKQILDTLQERLQVLPGINPSTSFLTSNNAIKAMKILDDPSIGDDVLGDLKTRNFSANILDQVTSPGTTIDIHASDAIAGVKLPGINRGMSSKVRYDFGMEVMKEAADALGVPPAALQAIDWVTWKSFFREAK
jgi:hypothetical protein